MKIYISFIFVTLCTLTVLAQPGSGILVGESTVLTPEANFTLGFTDNVNVRANSLSQELVPEEDDDDFFLVTGVALNLTSQGVSSQSTLRAWFSDESYFDNSQLDGETYGVNGTFSVSSDSGATDFVVGLSAQHSIDNQDAAASINPDQVVPIDFVDSAVERVERDTVDLTTELSHDLNSKVGVGVGYDYSTTDYENDEFRDSFTHTASGFVTYSLREGLDLRLTGGGDYTEREETPNFPEKFEGEWNTFYKVGLNSVNPFELTEKITFSFDVGYETRTETTNTGARSTEEEDIFTLDGLLNYAMTDRVQIYASANRGYRQQASTSGADREELQLAAGFNHRIANTISHGASVAWQDSEYLDSEDVDDDPRDTTETLTYTYRIGYTTPSPWFSLTGAISYEDGSTNFGLDYSETQASVTAAFRY